MSNSEDNLVPKQVSRDFPKIGNVRYIYLLLLI